MTVSGVMGALLLVCPCIDEHGRQHVFSTNTNPQVCTAVEHRAEPPNTLYLLIQLHRGSSVIQSAAESDVPAKKDKLQKFQHDESTEKPSFFSKQVCHINWMYGLILVVLLMSKILRCTQRSVTMSGMLRVGCYYRYVNAADV